MKIAQQWEAKQWVLKKVGGLYRLVMNYPARGTATRNNKHGKAPHSHLEARSMSANARALLAAIDGDTEACAGLTVAIAGNVLNIAKEKQWQRVDMALALRVATALIAQRTDMPTDVDLAGIIGVAERNYRATWKPRMWELYDRCMKPLIAEIS